MLLDSFVSGSLSAAAAMFLELADQFPKDSESRDVFMDASEAVADALALMERLGIL